MKEVILISDEYHEIENFIKKYSHKKINLLILEPQNLKTLNTILNYPEITFVYLQILNLFLLAKTFCLIITEIGLK